jgi:hypothetical protein
VEADPLIAVGRGTPVKRADVRKRATKLPLGVIEGERYEAENHGTVTGAGIGPTNPD